jgi:hypothetical protein
MLVTLNTMKGQVAELGMVLFSIRHKIQFPDDLQPEKLQYFERLLSNGVSICKFIINGPGLALAKEKTNGWEAWEIGSLYRELLDQNGNKGHQELCELIHQAPAVLDILTRLLHLTEEVSQGQMETAQKFFHDLYWLL